MTSRWAHWSRGTEEKKGFSSFLAEQESPADMAERMGLQSDGSGGYIDPSTGEVVARTVNNELVFYDPQGGSISAQSGGAQLTQSQPSWVDPVTGQLTVPPGQPESPEEVSAIPPPVPAQAPAGYNAFMNSKKKEMYAAQATPEQEAIDGIQQEVDPQLGMQPEMPMGEETKTLKKMFEDLPQRPVQPDQPTDTAPKPVVAQSIARGNTAAAPKVVKDTDGDGDVDIDDLRNTARKSWKNWTTARITDQNRVEKNLEPAIKALNGEGVNPQHRNRIMHSLMNAYRYEGRDNEASSDLNKAEFHALRDNKKRILEAYGGEGSDGSAHNLDAIRNYQKEINAQDIDDGLIDASFNAMSPLQQKIFKGGDMSARQGYGKYLRQSGLGGYTGLPLDYNTMQMEHFIDHTQARDIVAKAKAEGRDMTPEEQELHDFIIGEDNQFWSRQAPNEQKSSRTPAAFFDERVNPLEAMGDDFFDYRELTIDPARLDLKGKEKEMIGHLIEEDEDGNKSLSQMDMDQFGSHADAVNEVYSSRKGDLLKGLTEAFDKKSLMGLGPKAFDKRIADEASDITEDDRSQYDMLRNLQSKIKGYNPDFAYRVMQGLGLPTGFIQSERTRTTPVSPAFYQAIANQLPGKNPQEQREFLEKVQEYTKGANSFANSQRGQGLKDADIRKALYQNLFTEGKNNGILSDEIMQMNPDLMKIAAKYMSQNESLQDMMNVEEEDHFDIEDILDVIKELGLMDRFKANKNRKGKGLKFESFRARIEE